MYSFFFLQTKTSEANEATMRELAILLLDDEWGINEKAWRLLRDALEAEGASGNNCEDIINSVRAQDDRWFLPEGALESLKH